MLHSMFMCSPFLIGRTVSSLNILWTVRQTIICLIELSVHWTWFGQFSELYSVSLLAYREMHASAGTCSRQHDPKCRLKSSPYTLIIPHMVIQLTTISFWVPETRLCLPQVNRSFPSEVSEVSTTSSIFVSSSSTWELSLFSTSQRYGSPNWVTIPKICWTNLFGPRT